MIFCWTYTSDTRKFASELRKTQESHKSIKISPYVLSIECKLLKSFTLYLKLWQLKNTYVRQDTSNRNVFSQINFSQNFKFHHKCGNCPKNFPPHIYRPNNILTLYCTMSIKIFNDLKIHAAFLHKLSNH